MRVRSLAAVLAAALLALPALAAAQYDPRAPRRGGYAAGLAPQGFTLGARLGWGAPFGEISDEGDPELGDLVDSKVPIWLELGYRFDPTFWGNLYLELAPTSVEDDYCFDGSDCDAANIRFGVELQVHLAPYAQLDPWIGIGIGVEVLSLEDISVANGSGTSRADVTYTGLELPLLEAGLDIAVNPHFTLGPFVSWTLGAFTSVDVDGGGNDYDEDIDDRAVHGWFEIGIRGGFRL